MRADLDSTRETALPYHGDAMRTPTLFLPLFFLVADGLACKDDEPTGGEFGDPCGYEPEDDEETPCAESLECDTGYCEEECQSDADCQMVPGYERMCYAGLCHFPCKTNEECPQTLATPLECITEWCSSAL